MTAKPLKVKVSSNIGADYVKRYYNQFWTCRRGQLTTSNMRTLKKDPLQTLGSSASGKSEDDSNKMVLSDLQPHALHTFYGDENPSLVVAVLKSSDHYRNLRECTKASMMVGHTNAQAFHWFKQLGVLPPRGICSGQLDILSGDLEQQAWGDTMSRHPVIHALAEKMWLDDQAKTEEERVNIDRRQFEEDQRRMKQMSSTNWRQKFGERERNPSKDEDVETPVYVVKPELFAVCRMRPEVRLWTGVSGDMKRVYEPNFMPMDPLAWAAPRLLGIINATREKLVASINLNYNMKLANVFVYDMDAEGLWAMGTMEEFKNKPNSPREQWVELRIPYGDNMTLKGPAEAEWWIKGFFQLAMQEHQTLNQDDAESGQFGDKDFRYPDP